MCTDKTIIILIKYILKYNFANYKIKLNLSIAAFKHSCYRNVEAPKLL